MSAKNPTPIYVSDFPGKLTQFTSSNGTSFVDITPTDPNGPVRVDALTISNDDTASGVLTLKMSDGTNTYPVAQVAVAANSLINTGANAPLNLLAQTNVLPFTRIDSAGNRYIVLPLNWKLQAAMVAMPSSGKTFNVAALAGTFAPQA